MARVAPYGTWISPITLDTLVANAVGLSFPLEAGDHVYWCEARPSEGGRSVVIRMPRTGGGRPRDVFGPGIDARTAVHEYGGLCVAVSGHTVFFSNWSDQRLYKVVPGGAPIPITPEPPVPRAWRFAAPVVTADGGHLVAVRETHADPDVPAQVVNDLVLVQTDGSGVRVLAEGHDFYSHPVLSPDSRRLAWTSWDHPNMPWDGTELWEAELSETLVPARTRLVAGGPDESVTQPKYAPDGRLFFVSDRSGWWNLYLAGEGGDGNTALAPMTAEFGVPDWHFGASNYAVLGDGTVIATWVERGFGHLGYLPRGAGSFSRIESRWTHFSGIRPGTDGRSVIAVAASAVEAPAIVRITPPPPDELKERTVVSVLMRSRAQTMDPRYLSVPQHLEFPTDGGQTAYGFFYPPTNPDFEPPEGELPPLIVSAHGGPTGAALPVLDYSLQFWTSRGFAVVDVNYGGSTGYGRKYRERLRGLNGVVDVADCVHAARALADMGRVDGERLLIHGGSAGGFTVLCACTWTDVFAAGASYYGVADLTALIKAMHKFESRYADATIAPWPQTAQVYRDRSPITHPDRLRTPLILFQGLEDTVVPPQQADLMVSALRSNGVPHAYVAYEGEPHGFKKAENIKRTSEAELYFYASVLGIAPAEELCPVEIVHGDRLP